MENIAARSSEKVSGRNHCLDFFKGIAALGVVWVHVQFPGAFGKCMSTIGSCGVMLFFLISGYHAYGSRETICPKLMKRFRRNLCALLTAVAVYFAEAAAVHQYAYHDLKSWLRTFTKPLFFKRLLIWSDVSAINGDPLWFLFALLYAYLIFRAMYRLRLERFAKYAMPLFLLLRIGLETYKYAVNGDWRICSNVLVAAMPLMLLGYWIAERREMFLKIPAWAAAVCGAVSMGCVFWLAICDPFRWNITQIFKLTAVASAFVFAMKKPSLRVFPPLSSLGGAYSLHVYLWHMPIAVLLYPICEMRIRPERFYDWYLPLIVAALAVVLAVVIVTVQRAIKKMRHRTSAT